MLTSRRIEVEGYYEAVELFYERGWTDGLPVVPPTEERVEAMIKAARRDAGEVIGLIPPRWARATVEKIAVNAVMAGCRPEHFPVVLAVVEAALDEAFNLHGVQATTHVAAPLIIINGPVRKDLDINSGPNCFGQGWRANATIGRALRLVMINIGGGLPGVTDKSTFGHPGKYTYCVAENEEASPWEPLHVERGFHHHDSTVTLFAAEAPHSISDHPSQTAKGILTTVADSLATMGCSNMYKAGELVVVLSPEHAATIGKEGWSKRDVKQFLFEQARRPLKELRRAGEFYGEETLRRYWPKWVDPKDDWAMIPVVRRPEDIIVIVAGGPVGRFSLGIPGWGDHGTKAVTKKIAWSGGHDQVCDT